MHTAMETYEVRPAAPTLLAGQTHYPLRDVDLMIGLKLDAAWIVPGPIDRARFDAALAHALSVFPLYTGRIERPREEGAAWQVRLADAGVPVTLRTSSAPREVPTACVVQRPWTLTAPRMDIARTVAPASDEPLLALTLTRFVETGSTCVGMEACHVVGDGMTILAFARLLSAHYQGLPPPDPPPTYDEPPPAPVDLGEYDVATMPAPDLENTFALGELPPFATHDVQPLRVDLRLGREQVAQIRDAVRAQAEAETAAEGEEGEGAGAGGTVSRQDALHALIIYITARADPAASLPREVKTVLMNRGITRPLTAPTNALMLAISDPPSSSSSSSSSSSTTTNDDTAAETPGSIARRIRRSIVRARTPAYCASWDAAHAPRMRALAAAGRVADYAQDAHRWFLNSNWRLDWTSAHYGYAGQTRFFHHLLPAPRIIKLFTPNPVRMPDGAWARTADVEATFYLHADVKERFVPLFEEELRKLGVQGGCEWVTD